MCIKEWQKARAERLAKETPRERFTRRYINTVWFISASIPILYAIWSNHSSRH
ncbi:hypothetical protein B0G82_3594 [Paraburkholderia sp. BL17N1]|nr:hypothetical protein B0G82_3594 [Paraburkholderia sp. BL17N1]